MDAYHLLVGRPWQFDITAQHDGRENTYKLSKDGLRINLLPMKVNHKPKTSKVEGKTFFTITHFGWEIEEDFKKTKEVHALVVKQVLMAGEEKQEERHSDETIVRGVY